MGIIFDLMSSNSGKNGPWAVGFPALRAGRLDLASRIHNRSSFYFGL